MNVQIGFQCRFIISRGCSHSWLRASSVMEMRFLFSGTAVFTGARPFPRVGVSREGANASPWSQPPGLRRVLLQQPQQWCSGQGGDSDWDALTPGDTRDKNITSLPKLTLPVTKVTLPVLLESLELVPVVSWDVNRRSLGCFPAADSDAGRLRSLGRLPEERGDAATLQVPSQRAKEKQI